MNQIHLPDNLIKMRHKRNITQEQLAEFLGVTKASVSKWENRQSMPDILLLPKLAAFFDVSIDQLMGYEPQLSKEQIQKIYQDLSEEFVSCSFTETMKKSQELVKKYYSCYPFLLQICVLWINHFMLPEDREEQQKILTQTEQLCEHIIKICNAVDICNDAIALKALAGLQMGKAQEAVEALEDLTDPMRISGCRLSSATDPGIPDDRRQPESKRLHPNYYVYPSDGSSWGVHSISSSKYGK